MEHLVPPSFPMHGGSIEGREDRSVGRVDHVEEFMRIGHVSHLRTPVPMAMRPVCSISMILRELEGVVRARAGSDPSESYTARLLADPEYNQRKIMEEAFEVCLELGRGEIAPELVANEAADLLYHLLVGIVGVGVTLDDVFTVLEGRRS